MAGVSQSKASSATASSDSSLPPLDSGTIYPTISSATTTLASAGSDTSLVTATAPTSFTTVTITSDSLILEGTATSSTTFLTTSVVTNPLQYSSLAAAAIASSLSSKTRTSSSSNASSTTLSALTSHRSSSDLSTKIPVVVVPVLVFFTATLVAFWLFMRRRQRQHPKAHPEVVTAGHSEKLTSTPNRLISSHKNHTAGKDVGQGTDSYSQVITKPTPYMRPRDNVLQLPASKSNFTDPHPPRRFYSAEEQRPPRNLLRIGNRAPVPAPLKESCLTGSNTFVNQPQYSPFIRDAPKAKKPGCTVPQTQGRAVSRSSHPSPLLPPCPPDHPTNNNHLVESLQRGRLANSSHSSFGLLTPDDVSEISARDEAEEDVQSNVSSLNELERFDFENDTRADSGGSVPEEQMSHTRVSEGTGYESSWV